MKHRRREANRRDGTHCAMAGPMLVEFRIEDHKLGVVAPRMIVTDPDHVVSHRKVVR